MKRKLTVLEIFNREGNITSILDITHCDMSVRDFIRYKYKNIEIVLNEPSECLIEDYLDYSKCLIEKMIVYGESFLDYRLENACEVIIEEIELEYGNEYFFNNIVGTIYAFKNVEDKFFSYKISDNKLVVEESSFYELDDFILSNDYGDTSMKQLNFLNKFRKFLF